MLFFILTVIVVISMILLSALITDHKTIDEFCRLECKKDIQKKYKFCC